jgi:hypothetical protein
MINLGIVVHFHVRLQDVWGTHCSALGACPQAWTDGSCCHLQWRRRSIFHIDREAVSLCDGKVLLLCEPRYVITCVDSLREEKSCVTASEFPSSICILEVC